MSKKSKETNQHCNIIQSLIKLYGVNSAKDILEASEVSDEYSNVLYTYFFVDKFY